MSAGTAVDILLVDDDPFLLGLYSLSLEREGFRIRTAANGVEGLKEARAKRPDIILLDLMMPKMDGFETLRRIKSSAKTKGIPVIILSSLNQPDDVELALRTGAAAYLQKTATLPFEAPAKIRAVLGLPPAKKKPVSRSE